MERKKDLSHYGMPVRPVFDQPGGGCVPKNFGLPSIFRFRLSIFVKCNSKSAFERWFPVPEMPFKLIMALLADVHQVVMIQRYLGLVYIAAVKVYFVVDDKSGSLTAYLAQAAVLLDSVCNIGASAAFPFF